jgi:peptidoglycan/LPS O-acetylase OafA/YrhL
MLCGTLYRLATSGHRADRWVSFALRGLAVFYVAVLPLAATLAIHKLHNYTVPYAIGFLVFIAGTTVARIETRLTDWLGRISYSIYLFHPIVFQPIYLWLMEQPVASAWRTQHLAVYLVANVLLTLCAASLVFRFVERPMIRIGHRLAERVERRPRVRAAASCSEAAPEISAEATAA